MKHILIGIIVVAVIYYVYTQYIHESFFINQTMLSIYNFDHKVAGFEYPKILKIFGYPSVFKDRPNGFVMWKKPGIFEQIYIKDEAVKHGDHCDFIYATIKVHIPQFSLPKVQDLSESLMYDRLKQELTVRCGSLSNIVQTMINALEIVSNKKQTGDKYKWLKAAILDNHTQYADKLNVQSCLFSQGPQPSLLR